MALSYSELGQLDPPRLLVEDEAVVDLQGRVVDVTIGTATADYVATAGGLALAASEFGMNRILMAHGAVRGSTGAWKTTCVAVWDVTLSGLRFTAHGNASSDVAYEDIVVSDVLANGDIVRVFAVGV